MDISVILCTFNRCGSLSTAIDSIIFQVIPESVTWELLLVDNNSTDQTREVAEEYRQKYPERVRYVFEMAQGLSRARNAGVGHARGEIIVFVDDDIVAQPSWLSNLTASFDDRQWAGAGGRIVPPPDLDLPDWLAVGDETNLVGALLPLFDLGDKPCEMKRPPYGANMAFRKSMFEKYGLFRVDLGRCGESLLMGEDIEFGARLISAGESLRYEPSAVVVHPVPKDRLNKSYFRRWWVDFGRTRIVQRRIQAPDSGALRPLLSLASLVFRGFVPRVVRWVFTVNSRRGFYNECQIWMTVGEIAQTARRIAEPKMAGLEAKPESPIQR